MNLRQRRESHGIGGFRQSNADLLFFLRVGLDLREAILDNPAATHSGLSVQDSVMRHLKTDVQSSLAATFRRARVLSVFVVSLAGCQSFGPKTEQALHLKEADGARVEDPWTTQAGAEGRAGRPIEKEADPLNIRRFFLSEKAMEIERNCGLE